MGDFSVDLRRAHAAFLGPRPSTVQKLRFALVNSELHCVAGYRFGQLASRFRTRHPLLGLAVVALHRVWNRRLTHRDHCDINRWAKIGPGLLLMHRHGVLIGAATIGSNCVIHQNVTIGQRAAGGDIQVPTLGDGVWIGPGAVIAGKINVGDGTTISAGTVLSRDVPARCLVGGNPGRVISRDYDNSAML